MGLFIKNVNFTVSLSLTVLKLVGFWKPDGLSQCGSFLYKCHAAFMFMFVLGIYIITQAVDLFHIWGDLPLMTSVAFLLFTNVVHSAKIVNIMIKKSIIQNIVDEADTVLKRVDNKDAREIVKRCDRETTLLLLFYLTVTMVTSIGFATSVEKNQLPMRAWYPYNTSKTPAYQLTYVHQMTALMMAAILNICKDSLVSTLIAQCRCRLSLMRLAYSRLCNDLKVTKQMMYPPEEEERAWRRLRVCVSEHQAALAAARQLQDSFSIPTFMQFTVSLVIICVTAFQLISQTGNLVRLLSMGTYLLNMCFQVFIYCYQGNQISEESSEVASSAYECEWYQCSSRFRRALLVVMVRSRRVVRLTACGFTTLSLDSFTAIIKASYSLFTLLKRVEEKK